MKLILSLGQYKLILFADTNFKENILTLKYSLSLNLRLPLTLVNSRY